MVTGIDFVTVRVLEEESAAQLRSLVAKSVLSPGVMGTTDCRGDHAALAARGVELSQQTTEKPYGTEAILRDDSSGNWYSFTQRSA